MMNKHADLEMGASREQIAALPYRLQHGLEILILTSRETRRWIIPKGWPIRGKTLPQSAAREAYEEAGVIGKVSEHSIGDYHYYKRKKNGSTQLCNVSVFPLQVSEQKRNWPEKKQRLTRWVTCEEAAQLVLEVELQDLIRNFERGFKPQD
jgi:8-oxo-dGTP pyrophosphatase MutT (NUDIX family)